MVIDTALFADLFSNMAILIVLIAVYAWLSGKTGQAGSIRRIALLGGLFGLAAIACMHAAVPLPGGALVDQRNTVIVLGGVFGGPVVAIIAAGFAGAYRLYLGGAGLAAGLIGCGLAVLAGTVLHVLRNRIDSLPKAVVAAAAATLVILPSLLFVGDFEEGRAVLQAAGPPYAAAVFLGLLLAGLLLYAVERRYEAEIGQKEAGDRLRDFAGSGSDWLWETDAGHRFVYRTRENGDARPLWIDAIEAGGHGMEQARCFFDVLDRQTPFRDFEFSFTGDDAGNRQVVRISGIPYFHAGGAFAGFRGTFSDITATKQVEAALQRNEKLLSDIASISFDRIWETDSEHRYVFATDMNTMRKRGARPGSAFIGKTLWELIGADPDVEEGMGRFRDLLEARQPFSCFRVDIPLPNGAVSKREMSAVPIFDDNGAFQGFRGSTRDITDEFSALATLRASEENYRALIDGSVQGVFIHRDFKPIYANRACVDIFGYPDIDAVMKLPSVLQLWAPHEAQRIDAYRRGRLRGDDVPERFEAEGRRMDGSQIWLVATAKVIQWDGEVAIQTAVIDFTDRRRAEEALQKSNARMRAILDATPLAIEALDTEMRVTLWTRAAEEMYGWMEAEVLGKAPQNIPESERDGFVETAERARRSRSVEVYETKRMHRDGHPIDIRLFIAPIEGENGEPMGFLGVGENITGQKAIEDRLRQAQKMESIGQLTGGMAHDFNNLLGVILGNLDFALERIDDPEDLESLIKNAISAANRGAELNRHLLAFSRQMPLAPKVIDLNVEVGAMAGLLGRMLSGSITMEFVRGADLWSCEADPVQVESALLNLCLNARDAMPSGGHLTIETANARLDADYASTQSEVTPGQYVLLAVTDTGVGMSPEVREKVFEPFFTTKGADRGTGLGLSMVFGFAKQSGGHVAIYSEIGEGTTVKLYLPRALQSAVKVDHGGDNIPRGRGETVLVVEDHPQIRDLVVNQLTALGYTVTVTEDGPEALLALRKEAGFDLVLTDVVLPTGMNGTQVAAEAVKLHPGIGVLYMSGYTENSVIHHGRLDKGVTLLQKPFRRKELAQKVRDVLDTRM
ncbi:MAG: PAS domain S-box protein [Alphaproteobacteria bacterium]